MTLKTKKYLYIYLPLVFFMSFFFSSAKAFAAPLTFSSDTPVTLTGATITIKANSVADSVVVNANNIVVTISSSYGGTFVVTSPKAMTVTGGSISQVCNTGVETETITQSSGTTAYTLTPTGSACSGGSPHTISGAIKYYDGIKVIPSATVTLEDGSSNVLATTTTDSSGLYSFSGVADGGNYIVVPTKTDATTQGESAADQIKIGRDIVALELFDTIYKNIAGDTNVDGALSAADQIKIGRHLVGLDALLPSGAWKFYSSAYTPTTPAYLTTGLTRTYTNLTADAVNQDFVGIKMGDVNNSW
jgi:hypothetical protein